MASKSICTSCLRVRRMQALGTATTQKTSLSQQRLLVSSQHQSFSISTRRTAEPQTSKQPPPPPRILKEQHNAITSFAASVRKSETLKSTTEPYIAYGSTEDLFRECTKQCSYTIPSRLLSPPEDPPHSAAGEDLGEGTGWWYQPKASGGLGLNVTFNTWAQVMFLHMYMLTVRLRCFPAQHSRIWHQNLLDHFFYAAEDRMVEWHNISSRGSRNKYLKDLWQQWRGVILSYDEGLIKGDAVLAAAIWRNVFKASVETDVGDLALVTAYMRSQLQMLDGVSDEEIASGNVKFRDPNAMRKLLDQQSPYMKQTFGAEEVKMLQERREEIEKATQAAPEKS